MNSKLRLTVCAMALAASFCSVAFAAPVVYTGNNPAPAGAVSGAPLTAHNSFVGALAPSVTSQGFESLAVGTNTGASGLALTFAGTSTSRTATFFGDGVVSNNTLDGRFNTTPGGSKWWQTDGGFDISFSSPISAFGFYATDLGDFDGGLNLLLTSTTGAVTTLLVSTATSTASGGLLFFGFIDRTVAYQSIAFQSVGSNLDFFGFDDMIVGEVGQILPPTTGVPEPGSLALVALSLAALGSTRRKTAA